MSGGGEESGRGSELDEVAQLLAELARWTSDSRTEDEAAIRRRQLWLRQQSEEDTTWSALVLGWAESGAHLRLTTTAAGIHHGRISAVGRDFVLLRPGVGTPSIMEPKSTQPSVRAVLVATLGIACVYPTAGAGGRRADPPRFVTGPRRQGRDAELSKPEPPGSLGTLGHPELAHPEPENLGSEHSDAWKPAPASAVASPLLDLYAALGELAAGRPRVRIIAGLGTAVVGELRWVGSDVACLRVDGKPPKPTYVRLPAVIEVSVFGT